MSEFSKQRAHEALSNLEKVGIDAVILFPGPNIGYFTGFKIGPSERLAAAIIPQRGEPWFIVNKLEEELRGLKPWFNKKVIWQEHEDPIKLLVSTLKDNELGSATIGIPEDAPWVWVNAIKALLPNSKFVDASISLGYTRMVKTAQELGWMRKSCEIADKALENGFSKMKTGMTEQELSTTILAEINSLGGGQTFIGVLFGENAALPHGGPAGRRLKPGDCVLVDMGCTFNGYWSDLTRTAFYGEPKEKHRIIYETVLEANQAAFKAIKPGVTCESVDYAARKVIEDAGFGEYFIHRLGHGIGIQVHEHPYIVRNNKMKIATGMTFSDEPGIYIVGEVGVRIEDTVVCNETGAETLTNLKRTLTVYPVSE
jgi:Xaa-Pro dipeptidase